MVFACCVLQTPRGRRSGFFGSTLHIVLAAGGNGVEHGVAVHTVDAGQENLNSLRVLFASRTVCLTPTANYRSTNASVTVK